MAAPTTPGSNTPDVRSVQVSNDDTARISFVLGVLNQLDLGLVTNSTVVISLNTDGNTTSRQRFRGVLQRADSGVT